MKITENILSNDGFLFHGLPVIKGEKEWFLFSPYMKKKIAIQSKDEFGESLYTNINSMYPDFFGTPKATINDYFDIFELTLSLTENCNLRCKYCFVNGGESKKNLSQEAIRSNIDYAIRKSADENKKILRVAFFGGEPTLQFDAIKNTVDYARLQMRNSGNNTSLKFSITTNGVCSESVLDYMIKNRFNVTVSMDGLPMHQDLQRPLANGTGSSATVERSIKKLFSGNMQPRVRVTVSANSVESLPDIVRYLASIGVGAVQFEPVTESGRALRGDTIKRPPKEDYVKYLIKAMQIASEEKIAFEDASLSRLYKPTYYFCNGIGGSCRVVNPDGSISVCVEVNSKDHPANKYFIPRSQEEKSLIEQNGATNLSQKCKECFARYICAGGCPSRNFHMTGNVYTADTYRCYFVKALVSYVILCEN